MTKNWYPVIDILTCMEAAPVSVFARMAFTTSGKHPLRWL